MRRTGRRSKASSSSSLLSAVAKEAKAVVAKEVKTAAAATGGSSLRRSTAAALDAAAARSDHAAAAQVRASAVGAKVRRRVSFVSVHFEAEIWNETRWCDAARVSVKKNKVVVECNKEEFAAFKIDSGLIVEHSHPISRDFNLQLTSSVTGLNVRVALYSEFDALQCVEELAKAGAKVRN